MEACPGLARKKAAGDGTHGPDHSGSICEALCKVAQNDTIDAAAIAEAVTRPRKRFVQVKQPEQVDLQSLHRIALQPLQMLGLGYF
jgi:hypothetical protein